MRTLLLILLLISQNSIGQTVQGYFITDSIQLGLPFDYILICKHDNTKEIVFPNTHSNYKPFILKNIENYPTIKKGDTFIDSVRYTLVSYEVDKIQSLQMSVKDYLTKKIYRSNIAKVYFKNLVSKQDIKKPYLKPKLNSSSVPLDTNYPKMILFVLLVLTVLYLIWILMGDKIILNVKLWLFSRKQKEFLSQFKKLLNNSADLESNKQALSIWKIHMQWLTHRPFTTMSTKEIKGISEDDRLVDALSYVDAAVFGGQSREHIKFSLDKLLSTVHQTYDKQLEIYKYKLLKTQWKTQ
ncbi:MAG: hypothetical protein ACRCVT_09360 [Leadbetterella sp.]